MLKELIRRSSGAPDTGPEEDKYFDSCASYQVQRWKREEEMPNGGYPMNLQVPLGEGLGLMANGVDVALASFRAKDERSDWFDATELAHMTADQRDALLFHLLYWSGGGSLPEIRVGNAVLAPRYRSPGCFYSF